MAKIKTLLICRRKGDKLAEGIFHCFVISSKIQDALLTHISLLLGQVGHFVSEFKVQIITSWLLLELELRAASTYDRRYCPCNLNTEPELLLRDEETAAGVRMYYVGQFVLKLYTLYLRVCKHSYQQYGVVKYDIFSYVCGVDGSGSGYGVR